jgi:hypothetical protein
MKKSVIFISIIVAFAVQSCSVLNVSYSSSKLQDRYSISEVEIHGSSYMKNNHLNWGVSMGYAAITKEGLDYNNNSEWSPNPNLDLYDKTYSGLKLGISPIYYFSEGRFQPFLGCGFNALLFGLRKTGQEGETTSYDLDSYLYMAPNAGIRLFFARRFGVHAKVGYNFGKMNHPQISLESASGLFYSIGYTVTF